MNSETARDILLQGEYKLEGLKLLNDSWAMNNPRAMGHGRKSNGPVPGSLIKLH